MRNLLPLTGAVIDRYDRIVAVKHLERRQLLQKLRPSVAKRYDAYAHAAPALETLNKLSLPPDQVDALKHCYEVETEPLDELKVEIRERQEPFWRSVCAYCGINSPQTIEHYLPRVDFPEYAVCAYNLLPACGECNTLKGERWLAANGRRLLHLYYDVLPHNEQWLVATVGLDKGEPVATFTLQQPPGLSPTLFALIEAHYRTLHLLERYKSRAPELFSETLSSAVGSPPEPALLAQTLTSRALSMAKRQGHNYWKVAALLAMASSTEFLDRMVREARAVASPA